MSFPSSPPRIRQLPGELQRLIAAGEVVERPASVVRELIENALDAGARRITVEIEGGGSRRIAVSDDGCGIHPEDLLLAVERYATSKLRGAGDLPHVATLGFRGEALAAIRAAAHRLKVTSRPQGEQAAAAITCEHGKIPQVQAAARAPGTRVEVEGLFGHLPARRAFLRSPQEEAARCLAVVQAYALLWPGVAFSAKRDGKTVLATPGKGDLREACAAVWGASFAADLLMASAQVGDVAACGLLSPPHLLRRDSSRLVIGVRGRPVRAPEVEAMLEEAYRPFLTLELKGRRPQGVLALDLAPEKVDANVHPAKLEVRLREPEQVREAIRLALKRALGIEGETRHEAATATIHTPTPRPAARPEPAGRQEAVQPQISLSPHAPPDHATSPGGEAIPWPEMRVLGQALLWLVVAEARGRLYLVDQHAAHERLLYEEVLARLHRGEPAGQPLLSPVVVELSPAEVEAARAAEPLLVLAGIDVELLEERVYLVRALPPRMLQRYSAEEAARLLLLGEDLRLEHPVAATIACHSAVRRGDRLGLGEMEELLGKLAETAPPPTCPHGRPIAVALDGDELAQRFARDYRWR